MHSDTLAAAGAGVGTWKPSSSPLHGAVGKLASSSGVWPLAAG